MARLGHPLGPGRQSRQYLLRTSLSVGLSGSSRLVISALFGPVNVRPVVLRRVVEALRRM